MGEKYFTNYYEILQCNKSTPAEELKKCYQRLILSSHPDKTNTSEEKFLLIQKAWSILRDPKSRKQYDAALTCHEHSDHLLFDTIKLSEMNFNEAESVYSYHCRCGGLYSLEASDSIPNKVIIGCDECSFSIQIIR